MKRCERCQTEVPEEAAFCSACGLQFQRTSQTNRDVAAPNRDVAANLNKVNKIKLDDVKKLVNSAYTWSYDDDDWKKDRW